MNLKVYYKELRPDLRKINLKKDICILTLIGCRWGSF